MKNVAKQIMTTEQRKEAALTVCPDFSDRGGVLIAETVEGTINYNYNTDGFSTRFPGGPKGDLIDLICYLNGSSEQEAIESLTTYGIDITQIETMVRIAELIKYSGDGTDVLAGAIKNLEMLPAEEAQRIRNKYRLSEDFVERFTIFKYSMNGNFGLAIPVYDAKKKLMDIYLQPFDTGLKKYWFQSDDSTLQFFPCSADWDCEADIFIVNGPFTAMMAQNFGIEAVWLTQRPKNFPKHILSSVKGKNVVICLPDREYALYLAENFHKVARNVYLIEWSLSGKYGNPTATSLTDFLVNKNGDLAMLESFSSKFTIHAPEPLRRDIGPAPEFPVDTLPTVLSNAVQVVSNALQCSIALVAQCFMAVASLITQGKYDLVIDGRRLVISCFFMTIGQSGERKSACNKIALEPVRDYEDILKTEYSRDMVDYENRMLVYKKLKQTALKSDTPTQALNELGPPPEKPLLPLLICEDATSEGLTLMLQAGQPSIAVISDEAAKIIGGYSMKSEQLLATIAAWSVFWDGRPTDRIRVRDGFTMIANKRVTIHLMAQSEVAEILLGNNMVIQQGLLSRFLISKPDSTIGTRNYTGINLAEDPALIEYNRRITELLHDDQHLVEGTRNELSPYIKELSEEAKEIWVAFHDSVERKLSDDGEFMNIRGFASKAAEHAARLSCIFTAIDDQESVEIPSVHIAGAIQLVEYYLAEALRLFNTSQESTELVLADKLLQWLKRKYSVFSLTEIYQNGPNEFRDRNSAAKAVKILEDHRWIESIPGGATIGTHKRKKAWKLVA